MGVIICQHLIFIFVASTNNVINVTVLRNKTWRNGGREDANAWSVQTLPGALRISWSQILVKQVRTVACKALPSFCDRNGHSIADHHLVSDVLLKL